MKKHLGNLRINIKVFLKKFFSRLFPFLIFLILFDTLIGVLLFMRYYFKEEELKTGTSQLIQLNKPLIEKFTREYSRREQVFLSAGTKDFPNTFKQQEQEETFLNEPLSPATTSTSSLSGSE